MTQDELRQKCIEAMAKATAKADGEPWDDILRYMQNEYIVEATAAFDSLHGLVRVVPIEATEEMNNVRYDLEKELTTLIPRETFGAMAAAGDLTRPRKK